MWAREGGSTIDEIFPSVTVPTLDCATTCFFAYLTKPCDMSEIELLRTYKEHGGPMFGALDSLLAALDEEGREGFGKGWRAEVKRAAERLRESYKVLTEEDRDVIDYSDLATQTAYVLAYAIGRCAFTSKLLSQHCEALGAPLFGKKVLNVVSVGGGPGSELAGLLEFLESDEADEQVEKIVYRVLDKDAAWEPVIKKLIAELDTETKVDFKFFECDFTQHDRVRDASFENADLVICSFVMSELCALPNQKVILENFRYLFGTMDVGSAIFYNDSDAYAFYRFFNDAKTFVKGFKQQSEVKAEIDCSDRELGPTYEEMAGSLGVLPRLDSKALSKFVVRERA